MKLYYSTTVNQKLTLDKKLKRKTEYLNSKGIDLSGSKINKIKQRIKDTKQVMPFIKMKSSATGQSFSLYLKKVDKDEMIEGEFSSYGLSKFDGPTVPRF